MGDIYFRQRCMRKVHEMRASGVTILFVSHAISEVKSIGDRAMWLDAGRIRELGGTDMVATRYMAAMVKRTMPTSRAAPQGAHLAGAHTSAGGGETIPNIDKRSATTVRR